MSNSSSNATCQLLAGPGGPSCATGAGAGGAGRRRAPGASTRHRLRRCSRWRRCPYRRRGRWVVAARRSAQPPDSHGEDPRPRSVPDRAKHEPVAEEPDPQRDMRTVTLTDEDRAVRAPPDLEVDALALRRAVGDRDADPVAARAQSAAVDGHAVAVASVCLASVVCRRMHRGRGPCRRVREDSECDEDDQQENPGGFPLHAGSIGRANRPQHPQGTSVQGPGMARVHVDVQPRTDGCSIVRRLQFLRPKAARSGLRRAGRTGSVNYCGARIRASGSVAGSTGARRRWWVGSPCGPRQGGRTTTAAGAGERRDGSVA